MKNIYLLSSLILTLISTSCKNQNIEIINGTIYIKLIELGSLYKASDEKINTLKNEIDKFDLSEGNESEKYYYNYYKLMFKENLVDKPCFLIKNEDGKIKKVFCSLANYAKIEPFLLDLDKSSEQINLSLKVKKINESIYFANEIISVKKAEGKTEWSN
tara:strand:+ start:1087 stop:1563 length:477 start_codon:yes stop_codon:yes gene_type:complete